MKLKTIELRHVEYMPRQLEPGILYVADKYGAAAHLCACGCGEKIRTPLGPTEWSLQKSAGGPTLSPSVGNWQRACQSHYVIRNGNIVWAGQWTTHEIASGRKAEEARQKAYYEALYAKQSWFRRFGRWLKSFFGY